MHIKCSKPTLHDTLFIMGKVHSYCLVETLANHLRSQAVSGVLNGDMYLEILLQYVKEITKMINNAPETNWISLIMSQRASKSSRTVSVRATR